MIRSLTGVALVFALSLTVPACEKKSNKSKNPPKPEVNTEPLAPKPEDQPKAGQATLTPDPIPLPVPTTTNPTAGEESKPAPFVATASCVYQAAEKLQFAFCIDASDLKADQKASMQKNCERDAARLNGRISVRLSDDLCPAEIASQQKKAGCKVEKGALVQNHWDYSGKMPCNGQKIQL